MRWRKRTFSVKSREGETRVIQKFLLCPRCYNDDCRWLEFALMLERVERIDISDNDDWSKYVWKWIEIGFANPD